MPEQGRQHELESLRMQADASSKIAEHLVVLNGNIENLEKTVSHASDSSDRLAKALNCKLVNIRFGRCRGASDSRAIL